jgi:TRAP-type mannitol/chloroaromatic compound transport system permease small subunit
MKNSFAIGAFIMLAMAALIRKDLIYSLCSEKSEKLIIIGYIVYYLHLVTVLMLFLYMPYTKFAHIVYRITAMFFERFQASRFVVSSERL